MKSAKKLIAIAVTAAMLGITASPAFAASGITKDETVYVVTEADGSASDIMVSDHLVNGNGADKIKDRTNLTDIENVKGDETFAQGEGDEIIWDAGGNDIFYDGSTDKALPVRLGISYFLNGEEVSGTEMEGASGDVEIVINHRNTAKDENGTTIPFLAMTAFIAEDDCFTDIEIDHGKVIDDGDKQIVAGIVAPGLSGALDIDADIVDLDLDDTLTITGTAKDFNVQDMMTVVTNSVFEDIDADDFGDLDYDDQIQELDKGARQLMDGSRQLYQGIDTLYSNMPALQEGVDKLANGADKLSKGTDAAKKGAEKLDNGVGQLVDGLSPLASKIDSAAAATAKMQAGSEQILGGLTQLQTGLDGDGTAENPGAVNALNQVSQGLDQISAGLSGSEDQLKQLEQLKQLQEYADFVSAYISSVNSTINKPGVKEAIQKAGYGDMITQTARANQAAGAVSSGLSQVDVSGAVSGLEQAVAGIDKSSETVKKVSGGLGQVSDQMPAMVDGMSGINDGLKQMNEMFEKVGGSTGGLTAGLQALKKGSGQLASGEVQLAGGARQLARGMDKLQDSSGRLSGGVSKLDKGSLKLSQGMSELYNKGIRKIVDLYNNDLKGSIDDMKDVIDAGQSYETFTKLPEGTDGTVKFIYKTSIY